MIRVLKRDELMAFQRWYVELSPADRLTLHECFKIDKRLKKTNLSTDTLKLKPTKALLNNILRTWNGLCIENIEGAQKDKASKNRTIAYTICLPPQDTFKNRLDLFLLSCITIPEDRDVYIIENDDEIDWLEMRPTQIQRT